LTLSAAAELEHVGLVDALELLLLLARDRTSEPSTTRGPLGRTLRP
jgi:hypothetical protein